MGAPFQRAESVDAGTSTQNSLEGCMNIIRPKQDPVRGFARSGMR
jgi:hypothetical protein